MTLPINSIHHPENLSTPEVTTRKLASEMVNMKPDYKMINGFFTENAVVKITKQREMNRTQFVEHLKTNYESNIAEIQEWHNDYKRLPGTLHSMEWYSEGFQLLKGHQEGNEGYGLYRISTLAHLKFREENGQYKIDEYTIVEQKKIKEQ